MSNYENSTYDESDTNTPWFKVLKLIKPGSTVLDYGCSTGHLGQVLIEKKRCTVDGVELDKADAAEAAKSLRKVYINNIETEGDGFLGSNKYDVIYFGDVIEHLVQPVKVLSLVKKHLRADGAVVFSIPNMAHMSVRLMLLKGEFRYGETGLLDKTHLHFYDRKEISRIVEEAGYKLIELDYVKRDIPRDVLKAELQKIGLRPNKNFLNNSKTIESSAYQFIGIIKPSRSMHQGVKRPPLSPPINEMEKHIRYLRKVHKTQIDAHKARIEEVELKNASLQRQLNELTNQSTIEIISKRLKSRRGN